MNHQNLLLVLLFTSLAVFAACGQRSHSDSPSSPSTMNDTTTFSNEDWKKKLTPEQYRILRECGTERAFTGKFWNHHESGTYVCAGCGEKLFSSETKFESGSGWPSYYAPLSDSAIGESKDRSHGMIRVEIHCAKCGGHLGHVFDDGPQPTGLRYCVNSASLDFEPDADPAKSE